MRTATLGLVAYLALSASAHAVPITVTYTGTGSGSIDGTTFGASNFTITALGDTDNVGTVLRTVGTTTYTIHYLFHDSAWIDIDGVGSLSFVTGLETFVNNTTGVAGLSRIVGIDLYDSFANPVFSTYDLRRSLETVADSFNLFQWVPNGTSIQPVITDVGTLIFDRTVSQGTMRVIVPEPATVTLMLLGLLFIARRAMASARK
jgi:hypothetical protein